MRIPNHPPAEIIVHAKPAIIFNKVLNSRDVLQTPFHRDAIVVFSLQFELSVVCARKVSFFSAPKDR